MNKIKSNEVLKNINGGKKKKNSGNVGNCVVSIGLGAAANAAAGSSVGVPGAIVGGIYGGAIGAGSGCF